MKRKTERQLKPGWVETQISDVADVLRGRTLLKKTDIGKEGRNKCIHYGELYTKYVEVISQIESHTNIDTDKDVLSKSGDILLPGTVGTDPAKARVLLEDNVLLGSDINIIRAKNSEAYDSIFLAFYLTHMKKKEILAYTQGTAIYHLYPKDIQKLILILPPLLHQKRIASTLTTWDQSIQKIEELVSAKKKLYKKEFKNFLDETEMQEVELNKIVNLYTGKRPKGGATQSGVFSIGGEHITGDGNFSLLNPKYVPKDFYEKMIKSQLEQDDILLVKDGATTGKCAFWDDSSGLAKAAVNEHVFILRVSSPEIIPFYLFQFLLSKKGQARIEEYKVKSVIGGINRSIENMKIQIPSLATQKLNSAINRLRKKELLTLIQIKDKYKSQKKSLIQKLLTGEWEVSSK